MLTFGKQRPAHNSGTEEDVTALSSKLDALSSAVGLLATKQDVQNLPDSSSALATLNTAVGLLATKQDVQNLPDSSSELATLSSAVGLLATKQDVHPVIRELQLISSKQDEQPVLKEVQLQTNYQFPYLAVCGSNGVVHKLQENTLLQSNSAHTGLVANELQAPFSLHLDDRYRWTIVAIGAYQELNFARARLIVDGVPQAASVGSCNYLLPEGLEKSDGTSTWVLGWA